MKTVHRGYSLCTVCVAVLNLLAHPGLWAAPLVTQQAYLKASNPGTIDLFGLAVAASGDTIVIGANAEDSATRGINGDPSDNTGTNSGAAYVFVRQGNTWVQQAYLKASNTDPEDNFAYSVALSGDTLVVGAYQEDSTARGVNGDQSDNNGPNAGAVYVFERTGTNWVQQAYLKFSNTEFGERFGRSVAISGDTIVVGAYAESGGSPGVNGDPFNNDVPGSGAAYVFVRNGTNWSQQAYLKASNPGIDDLFGWSVTISGDTIAVGATGEDGGVPGVNGNQADNTKPNAGAVYVFTRTGTNWSQQAYVKASNPGSTNRFGSVAGDQFGFSVGLAGDTLVVGARNEASNSPGVNGDQDNNSAYAAGAAYVFTRTASIWTQQAYIKASNPVNISYFGWSVAALSEERVLVGAMSEWSSATGIDGDPFNFNTSASGAAYLFTRSGTNWSQASYIKASNTDTNDNFGWAVAGSGDTFVIGAPYEASSAAGVNGNQTDNSLAASGAAYLFTAGNPGTPGIFDHPSSRTNLAGAKAHFAVTASGNRPFQYQWRKDGLNLADNGNILGTQGPLLSILQSWHADEGAYDVIVSNDSGSVTSRVASLTVLDPVIISQTGVSVLTIGEPLQLSVEALGTAPLRYEWRHNGADIPGAAGPIFAIPHAQFSDAGEYRVTVANAFGATTTTFHVSQMVDGFDPRLSYILPGPTPTPPDVRALAIQPDGRFLVGGTFNNVNGVARFELARFQPGGAFDTAFKPRTTGPAFRVGVLGDGRILANEVAQLLNVPFFKRYLPDGATDPSFSIPAGGVAGWPSAAVVQQDGGVIFTQEDGPWFWSIRRLFPDGTPDESFIVGVDGYPELLAIQRDGKILVAGRISQIAGQARAGIGRLDANGSLDDSFYPTADWEPWAWIDGMAVQGDGKIVVTGGFLGIGGREINGIARLNPDGTADPGFTASFDHCCPGVLCNSIALQADGKMILGGGFDNLNNQPVLNLARLNPDGSLDTSFNPTSDGVSALGLDGEVTALALDASGRLLVSGYFTQVGGQARAGMARLVNLGPATESVSCQGSTITWQRGGTAPAVWATTFELSTDGSTWALLGEGTPIAGGWQFTGVSAPLGSRIRARGFIASGYRNESQGMVESVSTVSLRILSGNLAPQPFGFVLTGPANQSVVIEASTNLQNWIPLRTNLVPANGLLRFTDPNSITLAQRFYRGRVE